MTVASPAGYWDDLARHGAQELFWLSDPTVRESVNRRISGDPGVWPVSWFKSRVAHRLPFQRALSVGCGTGSLERALVRLGIASTVTGVDLVAAPIVEARRAAAAEGIAGQIRYVLGDAQDLLRPRGHWDAVFFNGALHHFEDVAGTLELARQALNARGILYVDEYVGRSRDQWRWWHLLLPNLAYRALPRALRRTRIIRRPFTEDDPSEQIRSAEILPVLARHFRVLERRDYGGNLLLLIYPSLRRPGPRGPSEAALARAVRRLLGAEDLLLRSPLPFRARSFHCLLWAEPSDGARHSHSMVPGGFDVMS